MADYLTWKTCTLGDGQCRNAVEEKNCGMLGGACRPYIDPYYIEVALCTIAGFIWLIWNYRRMMRLQELPLTAWQVDNANDDKPSINVRSHHD
jgi:MFS transporter, PAT family, solute carrier family 33 (acetyl-CoA transportor), member 1